MSRFRGILKTCVGRCWLALQSVALLAILFTPLWVQNNRIPATRESKIAEGAVILERVTSHLNIDREITNISSNIVDIKLYEGEGREPAALRKESQIHLESRQLRFEWSEREFLGLDWELSKIFRVESDETSNEIALLRDDQGKAIGSVYVELESNRDQFLIQLISAKTQKIHELRYFVSSSLR